jgi:hypothetical protein
MKKHPYSIMLDDTTDKSRIKQLAIKIQYWHPNNGVKCLPFAVIDASQITTSDQFFEILADEILNNKELEKYFYWHGSRRCFADD